jgi:hypothetical protein
MMGWGCSKDGERIFIAKPLGEKYKEDQGDGRIT